MEGVYNEGASLSSLSDPGWFIISQFLLNLFGHVLKLVKKSSTQYVSSVALQITFSDIFTTDL